MTTRADNRACCAVAGGDVALSRYRVELPEELLDDQGQMIDWLIGFTFDTLAARHLDLRIIADAPLARPERACAGLVR